MARRDINYWFIFTSVWWTLVIALSIYTATYIFKVVFSWSWFSGSYRYATTLFDNSVVSSNVALLIHIVTALPCLLIGPILFVQAIRRHHLNVHRVLGRCYVFTVFISAPIGFALAAVNQFGWVSRAGFMSLAAVWFLTTFVGFRRIRARDVVSHRRWMIRSYAISIAVISVRFLDAPEGISRETWYPIMTWACWIPNILIAQAYLRITDPNGRFMWLNQHRFSTR